MKRTKNEGICRFCPTFAQSRSTAASHSSLVRHERKCRDGNMGWGWPSPTVGAWISRMVREKYASLRPPRYSGGPSQLDPEYARFAAAVRRIPGSWILFESKIIRARPAAFLTALVDERGRPYLM